MVNINDEIKEMDKRLAAQLSNVPFDQGLSTLRGELWKIANAHNTSGDEVFRLYMEYKSKQ